VYAPLDVIVPALALQVTVELYEPVPATAAEHEDVPLTLTLVGEQDAVTDVIVEELVPTCTVVEPDLVGSCTEVAVTVAVPFVDGATKPPFDEMVPKFVLHVTRGL